VFDTPASSSKSSAVDARKIVQSSIFPFSILWVSPDLIGWGRKSCYLCNDLLIHMFHCAVITASAHELQKSEMMSDFLCRSKYCLKTAMGMVSGIFLLIGIDITKCNNPCSEDPENWLRGHQRGTGRDGRVGDGEVGLTVRMRVKSKHSGDGIGSKG